MKVTDFKIGDRFQVEGTKDIFIVTDVGSRVIVTIKETGEDPRNLIGPPYSIVEMVWDEFDLGADIEIIKNDGIKRFVVNLPPRN